jgi:hypothetical protein
VGRFGVEIHNDGTISYLGQTQQFAEVYACVDTAGQVRDRATLTRVAGGALAAGSVGAVNGGLLRKRVDERECYLLVTGSQDWVVPVKPSMAPMARTFAASVDSAGRDRARHEAELAVAREEGAAQRAAMARTRVNVYRPPLHVLAPASIGLLVRTRLSVRRLLGSAARASNARRACDLRPRCCAPDLDVGPPGETGRTRSRGARRAGARVPGAGVAATWARIGRRWPRTAGQGRGRPETTRSAPHSVFPGEGPFLVVTVRVPPAGFEPALPPPEGGALSPELRGP